jgi:hypothetical protein
MNTYGINTDVLNERLLKATELLKPLGINILCEVCDAQLKSYSKGMKIGRLDVTLCFTEPQKKE